MSSTLDLIKRVIAENGTASNATRAALSQRRHQASLDKRRASGETYRVVKLKKDGTPAKSKPFHMDIALSKERAEERKKALEDMNPGSKYEIQPE